MLDFLNSIIELLNNSFVFVFNFVAWFVSLVIWFICGIVNLLVNLLPNSPFTFELPSVFDKYMGYLNWIIPIGDLVSIALLWVSCIGIYYGYNIVMRWLKITK